MSSTSASLKYIAVSPGQTNKLQYSVNITLIDLSIPIAINSEQKKLAVCPGQTNNLQYSVNITSLDLKNIN